MEKIEFARPIAIGPRAVIVPTEEPVAIDIKQAIKNTPAVKNLTGIKDKPNPTTESTPPEADATVEKAPANMYIKHIIIMFESPQPSIKLSNLSLMLPLNKMKALIIPTKAAIGAGNW